MTSHVIKVLGAKHNSKPSVVTMLDGKTTQCAGEVDLVLDTCRDSVKLRCFVASSLVCGFSEILGMDETLILERFMMEINGRSLGNGRMKSLF